MNLPDRFVDRSGWPSGPWDDEPDRLAWFSGDLYCLINRSRIGTLCGYVGVPGGHPLSGMGMGDDIFDAIHVHGGVTWSDRLNRLISDDDRGSIDDRWMIGFDCSHCDDLCPKDADEGRLSWAGKPLEYRCIRYVRAEVDSLAAQIEAMKTNTPLGVLAVLGRFIASMNENRERAIEIIDSGKSPGAPVAYLAASAGVAERLTHDLKQALAEAEGNQ